MFKWTREVKAETTEAAQADTPIPTLSQEEMKHVSGGGFILSEDEEMNPNGFILSE